MKKVEKGAFLLLVSADNISDHSLSSNHVAESNWEPRFTDIGAAAATAPTCLITREGIKWATPPPPIGEQCKLPGGRVPFISVI